MNDNRWIHRFIMYYTLFHLVEEQLVIPPGKISLGHRLMNNNFQTNEVRMDNFTLMCRSSGWEWLVEPMMTFIKSRPVWVAVLGVFWSVWRALLMPEAASMWSWAGVSAGGMEEASFVLELAGGKSRCCVPSSMSTTLRKLRPRWSWQRRQKWPCGIRV